VQDLNNYVYILFLIKNGHNFDILVNNKILELSICCNQCATQHISYPFSNSHSLAPFANKMHYYLTATNSHLLDAKIFSQFSLTPKGRKKKKKVQW
jgi:hypothetical protein